MINVRYNIKAIEDGYSVETIRYNHSNVVMKIVKMILKIKWINTVNIHIIYICECLQNC